MSTNSERIITNLRFVDEPNRSIGATPWQHWLVRTIDELHAQILAVAVTDSKMRSVMRIVGREANGSPSPAMLGGRQELNQDFRESSHTLFIPAMPLAAIAPSSKSPSPALKPWPASWHLRWLGMRAW
jgi:hypothetical protein